MKNKLERRFTEKDRRTGNNLKPQDFTRLTQERKTEYKKIRKTGLTG